MDRIRTDVVGGIPFDAPDLDFLQNTVYAQFNALAKNISRQSDCILSGCAVLDGRVTAGYVYLNGELLKHAGTDMDIVQDGNVWWKKEKQLGEQVTTELGDPVMAWEYHRAVPYEYEIPGGVRLSRLSPVHYDEWIVALEVLDTAIEEKADAQETAEELAKKADADETVSELVKKVDKVAGKGLSTNDLTNTLLQALKHAAPKIGELRDYVGSIADFDSSGKGKAGTQMEGWAIANGQNGTKNLNGRVAVGYSQGDSDFGHLGKTGGEKRHALTKSEMPSHAHNIHVVLPSNTSGVEYDTRFTAGKSYGTDKTSSYAGGGQSHNNLQPYLVTYKIQYIGI